MFEIEHMNETFDYSLVDNETADFLKEREYTINGIAEDARIKIGKELKKAQDKLANHDKGVFYKWFESGGLNKHQVYYYINLVELSTNLDNVQKDNFLSAPKSLQKEVMKKDTPDGLKQKVLDGDITTHKEYKQLQQEKSELEQEKSQLESQLEQAQRSESIARKQLEEAEDKEPEVVEKYMEPDDYETAKEQAKKLSRENKELEQKVKFYESQRHKEEPVVEKQETKRDEPIDAREQINRDSRSVEPEVRRMMQYETSANALVSALEEIVDIHDKEIDDYEVFDKVLSTLNYKALKQAKEKINHFIQVGGY